MDKESEKEIQRLISDPLNARKCIDLYLLGRKNMQEEIVKYLKSYEMDNAVQVAYSIPVDYLEHDKVE